MFVSGQTGFKTTEDGFLATVQAQTYNCDGCYWPWTLDGCSYAEKDNDVGWITPIHLVLTFSSISACSEKNIHNANSKYCLTWESDGLWTYSDDNISIEYSGNNYVVEDKFVILMKNSLDEQIFYYISGTGHAGITEGNYSNSLTTCSGNAGYNGSCNIAYYIAYGDYQKMAILPYNSSITPETEIEVTISGSSPCPDYSDNNGTYTISGNITVTRFAGSYHRFSFFYSSWDGDYPYMGLTISSTIVYDGTWTYPAQAKIYGVESISSLQSGSIFSSQDLSLISVEDIESYFDSGSDTMTTYDCLASQTAAEDASVVWTQTV